MITSLVALKKIRCPCGARILILPFLLFWLFMLFSKITVLHDDIRCTPVQNNIQLLKGAKGAVNSFLVDYDGYAVWFNDTFGDGMREQNGNSLCTTYQQESTNFKFQRKIVISVGHNGFGNQLFQVYRTIFGTLIYSF